MSVMRERVILERTVTTEDGRTVLRERKISGVLDADGIFHLRAYQGKRFVVRQKSGKASKNGREAA